MTTALRFPLARAALAAALWLLAAGASANAQSLSVATDSSLAPAMAAVARAFEAGRSGVSVKLSVGAPGALIEQMAQGAPTDVLAGSDAETAALGQQRRLLQPELRSVFATNTLVLVTPTALQLPVQRLSDLSRPEVVRIAMGQPTLEPAGRYAREAINAHAPVAGAAAQAGACRRCARGAGARGRGRGRSRLCLRHRRTGGCVRGLGGRVRVVETLATTTPVRYLAHVAVASPQPALARDFVAYLRSEPARAVWQRFRVRPALKARYTGSRLVFLTSSITAYVRVSRTPGSVQMTLPMNSR